MTKSLHTRSQEFFTRAAIIHSDKYDYSMSKYIGNKDSIDIICKVDKHGIFKQIASAHLQGKGCPLCGINKRKLGKDEFIQRAIEIHGNKYDYTMVIYIDNTAHVDIICKVDGHGIFKQSPAAHLRGQNCKKCVDENRSIKKPDFVLRAVAKHGNKYDYTNTIIISSKIKCEIKCNICNTIFTQSPEKHLSGSGCQKCGGTQQLTTEKFIQNAKLVHGDNFDYSNTVYINNCTKIHIICNLCLESFMQLPTNHIDHKQGCSNCAGNKKLTTAEFIEKVKIIHNNYYTYQRCIYLTSQIHVIITCPQHGDFKQTPHMHGNKKQGCGKCNQSHGERNISIFLTKLMIPYDTQKTFEECKNINKLPFDFYVGDFNLLIEFQGRQHFEAVEIFGGEEQFQKQQLHDNIKKQFCIDTGYKLLEIKYDEDVETKLIEYFKSINCWKDLIENSEFYNE